MPERAAPRVSVCVTAYNHASYIRQALDSVLAQETDFAIEILVGEDASTDGTREIVEDYARRDPSLFRLFLHDGTDKIRIGPVMTGRRNFVNNLRQARGEYVALLEGDDYWTDTRKLQLQVEALERNPQCSLAYHDAGVLDAESGEVCAFSQWHPVLDEHYTDAGRGPFGRGDRIVPIEEILTAWKVPTASIVYRRSMLGELPDWYFEVLSGDYALQLLLADKGPFRYLDRSMSVYRRHAGGISNRFPPAWFHRNLSQLYRCFDQHTGHRHANVIYPLLARRYRASASLKRLHRQSPLNCVVDLFRSLRYRHRTGDLTARELGASIFDWCLEPAQALINKVQR